MDITQTFYNSLASQYDKLFLDWKKESHEQAVILNKLFYDNGFSKASSVLDCACGIGTQAIGLSSLGYNVTASDISDEELKEARVRAEEAGVTIRFEHGDFRNLSHTFSEKFDVVICMDNALPHMLSEHDLEKAISSISNQIANCGMFVASIRDYDTLLTEKPPYSPPYIHKTDKGQRVSFQAWFWEGDHYKFTQYIIDDEDALKTSKFECEYRAIVRDDLTKLLLSKGFREVMWKFPDDTGFYQPIVIAKK